MGIMTEETTELKFHSNYNLKAFLYGYAVENRHIISIRKRDKWGYGYIVTMKKGWMDERKTYQFGRCRKVRDSEQEGEDVYAADSPWGTS